MAQQTGMTIDVTDDLITQNNNRGKSARKSQDELESLIEKARTKHKEDFENEIERNYEAKAKQVKKYKISNFGIDVNSPFEFQEEFDMDGWIKKAGNNYILDFGKLITGQLEIEKDQRERVKDIYMPFPRSFSYHIEFTLPDGYSVDGLDRIEWSGRKRNRRVYFQSKTRG